MLKNYLMIGLGGGLGAACRVALCNIVPATLYGLPVQILVANVVGCLLAGFGCQLLITHWNESELLKYFFIPGFFGGFTTFSAFALDVRYLTYKSLYTQAALYIVLSVVLSLICFYAGAKVAKMIY